MNHAKVFAPLSPQNTQDKLLFYKLLLLSGVHFFHFDLFIINLHHTRNYKSKFSESSAPHCKQELRAATSCCFLLSPCKRRGVTGACETHGNRTARRWRCVSQPVAFLRLFFFYPSGSVKLFSSTAFACNGLFLTFVSFPCWAARRMHFTHQTHITDSAM